MNRVDIFKLNEKAIIPTRNLKTDCGLDLYALDDVILYRGETVLVRTGIAVNVPEGFIGKLEDRSSLARKGLKVSGGVIDPGYQGDVSVLLTLIGGYNHEYRINAGDKIAQLLLFKVETPEVNVVECLWNSERGTNGFGSSGK